MKDYTFGPLNGYGKPAPRLEEWVRNGLHRLRSRAPEPEGTRVVGFTPVRPAEDTSRCVTDWDPFND